MDASLPYGYQLRDGAPTTADYLELRLRAGLSPKPSISGRTLAQRSGLPSERHDGSDRGLHERVGERARELMNGFPAGAVRR